ncbi:hypothetical protein BS50DRAFT_232539 [Corynespora cassiicola Philippines]|uniref:Uncharacterized protein n=1 Tax=Corynespora cassiicola Philippines TaxID=1448308 RepID=A0A2T2P1Y2_CORCC|nr:hypothetical protein BS50DRAFT_232539 [Corynespora cassiicola Philippines]
MPSTFVPCTPPCSCNCPLAPTSPWPLPIIVKARTPSASISFPNRAAASRRGAYRGASSLSPIPSASLSSATNSVPLSSLHLDSAPRTRGRQGESLPCSGRGASLSLWVGPLTAVKMALGTFGEDVRTRCDEASRDGGVPYGLTAGVLGPFWAPRLALYAVPLAGELSRMNRLDSHPACLPC